MNDLEQMIKTSKEPKCSKGNLMEGMVSKNNNNYCFMYQKAGDSCPYLRLKDNFQECSYYKK